MAGSAGLGPSAQPRGMRLAVQAVERAVGHRRPVPGNSPDDRKDHPDFQSSQESLRPCPPARSKAWTLVRRQCAPSDASRALNLAFSRHDGIYRSDVGVWIGKSWDRVAASRWSAPDPATGRDGSRAPRSSSAMSSGRLFLDRVARQQNPSPLHRPPQITTHSPAVRAKDDISTLPGRRHFYFALTHLFFHLDTQDFF